MRLWEGCLCRFLRLLFVCHDVEHGVVDLVHAVVAETAKVADGAVHVAFAQAVGGIHHTVVVGQLGTDKGAVEAGAHLEGAAGFGTVAYHAGNGVDHILDGITHLFERAAMEEHDAAGHADAGVDNAAKSTESADAALDVDGHEVVEDQCTGYLLVGAPFGLAVVVDGEGTGNALIAAAAVAVDGECAAVHAGIGGGHGTCHNGVDDVSGGVLHQYLACLQAIAFKAFGGCCVVVFDGLIDEVHSSIGAVVA